MKAKRGRRPLNKVKQCFYLKKGTMTSITTHANEQVVSYGSVVDEAVKRMDQNPGQGGMRHD